jgi:hypothetical protein
VGALAGKASTAGLFAAGAQRILSVGLGLLAVGGRLVLVVVGSHVGVVVEVVVVVVVGVEVVVVGVVVGGVGVVVVGAVRVGVTLTATVLGRGDGWDWGRHDIQRAWASRLGGRGLVAAHPGGRVSQCVGAEGRACSSWVFRGAITRALGLSWHASVVNPARRYGTAQS